MPARKKVAKKKSVKSPRKRSRFSIKKFFLIFIVLGGLAIILSSLLFASDKNFQSISSTDTWEEQAVSKGEIVPQGGGTVPANIASATVTYPIVENTGTWNGRQIQVVKDSTFTNVFKSSGIFGIDALKDGRLFMGGNAGFAIKYSEPEWRSVTEYVINGSAASNVGVVTGFISTASNPATTYPDVYIQTTRGILRFTSQYGDYGNTSIIADPSDPFGYLKNVTLVEYPDSNGVAAYRSNELYYLESGTLRKWKTPARSCGSDQIVSAYFDQNRNKTYFLMKECQNIYLYDLTLSSVLAQPLVATRLARLDNFPVLNGLIQIEVGGKSTGLLYMTRIGYSQMWIIKNYDPNMPSLSFESVKTPTYNSAGASTYIKFKNFDIEYGSTDSVWATQDISTGSWWVSSNYATKLQYMLGNDTIANKYTNDITVSQDDKNVYVSHQYLPNQFKSGLVTIIGKPVITPTPTKKVAMCKATMQYMRTKTACRPTKSGSTMGMDFGCSDGYVGTRTANACTSIASWTAIAKSECSKRMTPCK